MSTPFTDIYKVFMRKVTDYHFINLTQSEVEKILEGYMDGAITKFKKCKKKLSDRDLVNKLFAEDLDDEEKEILGSLMLVEWLNPSIYAGDLLKQTLSSKDYNMYSQANHLKEVRELRDKTMQECNKMMIDYTYNRGNLEDLR